MAYLHLSKDKVGLTNLVSAIYYCFYARQSRFALCLDNSDFHNTVSILTLSLYIFHKFNSHLDELSLIGYR